MPWQSVRTWNLDGFKKVSRHAMVPGIGGVKLSQALPKPNSGGGRFPTTRWTTVRQIAQLNEEDRLAALSSLYRAYWTPIHGFIRRAGFEFQEAEDLAQDFLLKFSRNNSWSKASAEKGRLRGYLCTALRWFLLDECEKRQRGLCYVASDVPDQIYQAQMVLAFDRDWALKILERTQQRLRAEFDQESELQVATVLLQFILGGDSRKSQSELGAELGLSEAAVKMRLLRLRTRWRQKLREEIAWTVKSPDEIDGEIRHLMTVLSECRQVS